MPVLFLSAFIMSITFAAQPGVIALETIRRGFTGGWRPAFLLEFGSLVGDATWAVIALLGAAVLFQNRLISVLFGFFGCFLLLRFAWGAYRTSHISANPQYSKNAGRENPFAAGVALSLSNPGNLTFWLGMSGTLVALGFVDPRPIDFAVFFAGFMGAQFLWCFFMAWLVTVGRKLITPRSFRLINRLSAIMLALLGASLALGTIQSALHP
ncbi:MAG: LysE family translocator [Anaerolineae bacterium]|nr:LysE family translocator [Anaerolineae bacterium]NUQ05177.1 LysE family transporter [Anaerolineae bacterium]